MAYDNRGTGARKRADLVPGPWVDLAKCRHVDPALFFPARGDVPAEALAVCRVCPVRPECLSYALDNNEVIGVWGGTTAQQRANYRAGRIRKIGEP